MSAPNFIWINTSLGYLIINTNEISHVQPAKVSGGQTSPTVSIINLKVQIQGFTGIEVKIPFNDLIILLDAKAAKQ